MPRYTDNLSLILPRGSKYWNYTTWNQNMEILDAAAKELEEVVTEVYSADKVSYDNTFTPMIVATTVQDAIPEIKSKSDTINYISIMSNTRISVPINAHAYYIISFGETVYDVEFVKSDPSSEIPFIWMNGMPDFQPETTYELSFLNLCCIWYERSPFDFEQFFEYYIENNVVYITKIKAQAWYAEYHNYNFIVPNYAFGYPVMLDDN